MQWRDFTSGILSASLGIKNGLGDVDFEPSLQRVQNLPLKSRNLSRLIPPILLTELDVKMHIWTTFFYLRSAVFAATAIWNHLQAIEQISALFKGSTKKILLVLLPRMQRHTGQRKEVALERGFLLFLKKKGHKKWTNWTGTVRPAMKCETVDISCPPISPSLPPQAIGFYALHQATVTSYGV